MTLVVAAGSAVDPNLNKETSEELHTGTTTYNSNRQQTVHYNGKHSRLPNQSRAKQDLSWRLTPNKTDSRNAPNTSINDAKVGEDTTRDSTTSGPGTGEGERMLMASAGRKKSNKSKQGEDDDDDDEDKKTLSQQIAEGKYGLIEKEIFSTTPKRPGIISYASNPEVPRDTAKTLGGLEPEEIWLAENHVLVLRGGVFPEYKPNATDDSVTVWPPIDDFNAPPRQVKIPANPKVPPPFPVQLREGGPTQFIGFNGTAGRPPFPPFFPQPPPGNGSYFAPPFPFPFPPPGNFTPGFYPPVFPENSTPGGGSYPPPGNGSFSPPQFPYPLPPPRNGSYFAPPPGNFTPGSKPFYPPPFPGLPPLPYNATFYPPYPLPPPFPPNGTLPFPPPFLNLPPGAAFLPPPGNLTEPFDEDDPSLYYPPPYDFYYPKDNSSEVPPGPLVPGIILPPPPDFFAPLNDSDEHPTPPPTTGPPVTDRPATPHSTYLPEISQPPVTKTHCPPLVYLPVTTDVRKRPQPTVTIVDDVLNHITSAPEIDVLTTPRPEIQKLDQYTEKPARPSFNVVPKDVQITHQGKSPIEQIPQQGYYYEKPTIAFTPPPKTIYSNVQNDIVTTAVPELSYYTVPLTDIIVHHSPRLQSTGNVSNHNAPAQSAKTHNQHEPTVQSKSPTNTGKEVNIPTAGLPRLVYYDNQQYPLDIDTNKVTPSPQPYFLKTKTGITATISPPPLLYYTVPSVSTRNPAPVKTSFYFYEEPNEGSRHVSNPGLSVTTQAPPLNYRKPTTVSPGRDYDDVVSPTPQPYYDIPSTGEKTTSPKPQHQQYVYSDVLPVGHSVKGIVGTEQPQYVYSDVLPVEHPAKNPTQAVFSQVYSDLLPPVKSSGQSLQYTHSGVVPVEQNNGGRQRTRPQSYVLPSALPVGQQAIIPIGGSNLPKSSTPAPPRYYYVTVSPRVPYELVSSPTPSIINDDYSTQKQRVKSTLQPPPLVSKLTYFTTPRPNFSSQRPILYNIQPSPSPRPIYQYEAQKNGNNLETQQPRQQNIYTTTRTKSRKSQRFNNQGNSPGAVLSSVHYQSTPRTLFEYSYEQSTRAPQVQQFYSALAPQYSDQEDVTAGSPTMHYSYEESGEQKKQRQGYQSTPRTRFSGFRRPQAQLNIHPTPNPLHAYFTRQDETLLDDITKKYFTIFGQKLQTSDQNVPTTPIPPYVGGNVPSQSKQPYPVNSERQYYTTPVPSYSGKSEHSSENSNGNKAPLSLADDININYKNPSLPVNPLSELIDERLLINSQTGAALVSYKFPGDGGHFYFITPQIVGAEQSQQPNGFIYQPSSQAPHQPVRYRRKKRKEQR